MNLLVVAKALFGHSLAMDVAALHNTRLRTMRWIGCFCMQIRTACVVRAGFTRRLVRRVRLYEEARSTAGARHRHRAHVGSLQDESIVGAGGAYHTSSGRHAGTRKKVPGRDQARVHSSELGLALGDLLLDAALILGLVGAEEAAAWTGGRHGVVCSSASVYGGGGGGGGGTGSSVPRRRSASERARERRRGWQVLCVLAFGSGGARTLPRRDRPRVIRARR